MLFFIGIHKETLKESGLTAAGVWAGQKQLRKTNTVLVTGCDDVKREATVGRSQGLESLFSPVVVRALNDEDMGYENKIRRKDTEHLLKRSLAFRAARFSLKCESWFFFLRIEINDSLTILHTVCRQ